MCLAVPGQVLEITRSNSDTSDDPFSRVARVAFAGIVKESSLALLPDVGVGDWVLVHAGFAITKLDEAEARRTMAYLEGLDAVAEQSERPS